MTHQKYWSWLFNVIQNHPQIYLCARKETKIASDIYLMCSENNCEFPLLKEEEQTINKSFESTPNLHKEAGHWWLKFIML